MNPLYRNDKPGQYPESWYAATAEFPPERPQLRGHVTADVAIVGAGFTGLSAALELAERGFDVVVLDAHRVGFGASGRNGGQVGSGFNSGQEFLETKLGLETAKRLWALSLEAKAIVRGRVERYAPEARWRPGVVDGFWSAKEAAEIPAYVDRMQEVYGSETLTALNRDEMYQICRSPVYAGGMLDTDAGHIHPLRYVLGLARAAEAAGAVIHERSEVHHVNGTQVRTGQGDVTAKHVILAGNGYMPNLNRALSARVMPINSFIAATEPLGDRAAEVLSRDVAVADSKFVVNYFRLSEDQRLLFGGRESYSIGFPRDITTALRARMERLFPQLTGVKIDHVWGGTLGITMTRLPFVAQVAPGVLTASGFSGHGVALTGLAGRVLAEAIAGQEERFDLMNLLPTPPFPGGAAARGPFLTLAMTWFAMRDRLGI